MQEAVSAVLHDRARTEAGINRMLAVSIAAHVGLVAAVWLMPADWRQREAENRPVMSISLASSEGVDTGGMTAMSGRAIQTVATPDTKVTETPPAAKPPEMVEPERLSKPTAKPRPIDKPAEKSTARAPTAGAEIKQGSAPVNTRGAQIPFGGGLAQGGGPSGGAGVRLDVQNFCFP